MEKLQNFDIQLMKWIYLHRYKDADNFLIWITEYTTYITVGVILFIIIFGIVKKDKTNIRKAFFIALGVISSAVIVNLLKLLFKRTRAYEIYDFLQIKIDAGGYSFPSGHTTEVFALAIAVSFLFTNKFIRIIIYLWAFIIAYTRIALGAHYPADVVAGIFVGTIVSLFVVKNLSNRLFIN